MNWLTGRSGAIALLVSVAINVVLVTAIGVHLYVRDGYHHDHRWAGRDAGEHQRSSQGRFGIDRLADRLNEADGKALRAAFGAKAEDVKTIRESYREARSKLREALRSDPYDGAAVAAAMATLAEGRNRLQDTLQGVIATAAAGMSHEGRVKLADRGRRGRR